MRVVEEEAEAGGEVAEEVTGLADNITTEIKDLILQTPIISRNMLYQLIEVHPGMSEEEVENLNINKDQMLATVRLWRMQQLMIMKLLLEIIPRRMIEEDIRMIVDQMIPDNPMMMIVLQEEHPKEGEDNNQIDQREVETHTQNSNIIDKGIIMKMLIIGVEAVLN